jgi:dipeptidase D
MTNTLPGSIDPVFSTLEPAAVWAHFATLCRIPRQSKAEGGLRDEIQRWALARGLSARVDSAGNLLLGKAASRGMEEAPGVVLQAHLDMVCEKNSDTVHDFSRDPIQPLCRDGWLLADNTTLGADNGIGVALILAVFEDDSLTHGALEALLTVDEEAGMGGAHGLQGGLLQGQLLLNLDTEEWGEFYLGCAGGTGRQCASRWSRGSSAGRFHGLAHRFARLARWAFGYRYRRRARQRHQTSGSRAA